MDNMYAAQLARPPQSLLSPAEYRTGAIAVCAAVSGAPWSTADAGCMYTARPGSTVSLHGSCEKTSSSTFKALSVTLNQKVDHVSASGTCGGKEDLSHTRARAPHSRNGRDALHGSASARAY